MYDKLKLLYPRMRGTPDISGYLDKAKEQTDLKTGEVCIFGSLDGLKVSIYTGGYSIIGSLVENPLKVVPLIHSNLTPVKFSHSPFCLFLFSSYSSCPLCRVLH